MSRTKEDFDKEQERERLERARSASKKRKGKASQEEEDDYAADSEDETPAKLVKRPRTRKQDAKKKAEVDEPDSDDEAEVEVGPVIVNGDAHFAAPGPGFVKSVVAHLRKRSQSGKSEWMIPRGKIKGQNTRLKARRKENDVPQEHDTRSYRTDRIKQTCRWISTTVYLTLRDEGGDPREIEEVQATIWPAEKADEAHLYISANHKKARDRMRELFVHPTTARESLKNLTDPMAGKKRSKDELKTLALGRRPNRHPGALASVLAGSVPKEAADRKVFEIVQAALDKPAQVAEGPEQAELDKDALGIHAERRLQVHISRAAKEDVTLDPRNVGGLKRPCVFCYLALYAKANPDHVHPGPLWFSSNAAAGIQQWALDTFKTPKPDPKAVADYIYEKVPVTFLSPNTGMPSSEYGHDTDSESDLEFEDGEELDDELDDFWGD